MAELSTYDRGRPTSGSLRYLLSGSLKKTFTAICLHLPLFPQILTKLLIDSLHTIFWIKMFLYVISFPTNILHICILTRTFEKGLIDLGISVRIIEKSISIFSNFSTNSVTPYNVLVAFWQKSLGILIIQDLKFSFAIRQIRLMLIFVPYCHCCCC